MATAAVGNINDERVSEENDLMPLNYSKIEDGLYLGDLSAATNIVILKSLTIERILTVFNKPIIEVREITYCRLEIDDTPNEDILSYLPQCIEFIKYGQTNRETVLVHSGMGYSPSVAVVIAFIMHKYSKSYGEALDFVGQRTPNIAPNSRFGNQLKIFERMEYNLDVNIREFRLFMSTRLIDYLKPQVSSEDPRVIRVKSANQFLGALNEYFTRYIFAKMWSRETRGREYLCRKCNNKLFDEINVIRSENSMNKVCHDRLIFIEPKRWMNQFVENKSILGFNGTITCINCSEILGEYNLSTIGFSCSCPLHIPFGPNPLHYSSLDYSEFRETNYKCLAFKIHANRCKLKRNKRIGCCCC